VSLRMLTILRLADTRQTTAHQRSTGQNRPTHLYIEIGQAEQVRLNYITIWFLRHREHNVSPLQSPTD
jgi:hypothetical protein